MTVKEYLSQPKELKKEIQCDLDNLAAMRSVVENCTTHLSFTAGRNPSKNKDAFEDMMLAITMEEERIRDKIQRLAGLEIRILKDIFPERHTILTSKQYTEHDIEDVIRKGR